MLLALAFGCGSLLTSGGGAVGQERGAQFPKVGSPVKLESYADVALVVNNARRTIELLATAQMKLEPYPEPPPKQIAPDCDSAEVRSFNRGYLLAHTGFNIFLSLQELG